MPLRPRLPEALLALALICLLTAPCSIAPANQKATESGKASARAVLRDMRKQTLAELYRQDPQARVAIRGAAGYGVFESAGAHLLLVGGSGGRGILRDNLTGKETFMLMGAVRAGLGLGFEDLRTVLVFKKRQTLKDFVEKGWTFGADAAALAQVGGKGGAREVETQDGILIYQLTKAGAIVRGSVAGTRYWKDEELN
jgi:lipid-binding SYLF domain-containing protein